MAAATARWATLAGSLPWLALDDLGAQAIGPDRELLDGRGAKRVARAEHDLLALRTEAADVSLAIDVVLPAPFTPATMITVGPLGGEANRRLGLGHQFLELRLDRGQQRRPCGSRGRESSRAISSTMACGRLHAHVGLDEDGQQLVEKRVVDQAALAFEQIADVGIEQLPGLCQTLLDLVEKAHETFSERSMAVAEAASVRRRPYKEPRQGQGLPDCGANRNRSLRARPLLLFFVAG